MFAIKNLLMILYFIGALVWAAAIFTTFRLPAAF